MDARQQRGLLIAATAKVERKGGIWLVPSQSGRGKYTVCPDAENPHCSCPDHEERGVKCKHIYAAEYVAKRERNPDGSVTVTETLTVTETVQVKRKTYPQNWPAYNKAQTTEKEHFQRLLAALCRDIPEQERKPGPGRNRIPLPDVVFAATFKVYSTFSGRRFMTDLRGAHGDGHMKHCPHYNSIFRYLENEALTPILKALIVRSSLPLKTVEVNFAVDSSGFSTCRYVRWYDEKYSGPVTQSKQHDWLKAHIISGVKTNVITAAEVLGPRSADSPELPGLLGTTAKNFRIGEVSADKGFASVENAEAIAYAGGLPFIMFKKNATGEAGGPGSPWENMFHWFSLMREDFLKRYHRRSNVESTLAMIKAKMGEMVRSKTPVAQVNEVLCKIVAHNICCVIQEMNELGIKADFGAGCNFALESGAIPSF